MSGHATLFDVCSGPVLCGERARTSRILYLRLNAHAFEEDPRLVAQAIRKADAGRVGKHAVDGIMVDAVCAVPVQHGASLILVTQAAIAIALNATVPVDVVVPANLTRAEITSFCGDSSVDGVGVVFPLDVPIAVLAEDAARWAAMRDCFNVPATLAAAGGKTRSVTVRIQLGAAPDRAVLEFVHRLTLEEGVTTIAIATDSGARPTHIERMTHAIDAMWFMRLSPHDIPYDNMGALLSPQETDSAIIATLRKSFPIDVGNADASILARVPGVGRAAIKIVAARMAGQLNYAHDFIACGVDLTRARPFLRHHSL
ncbi:MAG: hypothetical protein ACR2M1_04240 [Gemmatimonadaceae bacterium]